jgi:hypothetical protein
MNKEQKFVQLRTKGFDGLKQKLFSCLDHSEIEIVMNEEGPTGQKEVFYKGCGLTFITIGKPISCPRCHNPLPLEGA